MLIDLWDNYSEVMFVVELKIFFIYIWWYFIVFWIYVSLDCKVVLDIFGGFYLVERGLVMLKVGY